MKTCSILSEINYKSRNINFKDYEKECKRIFKKLVYESKLSLFGYPIRLVYENDFNKCFEKLLIGDPKNHNNTKKLDRKRLERIHWINEFIQKFNECSKNIFCESFIFAEYKHDGKKVAALFCPNNKYGIFFVDKRSTKDQCFILTSAYVIDYNNTIKMITNNKVAL